MWRVLTLILCMSSVFSLGNIVNAEEYIVESGESIQEAINKADEGATIRVKPGRYVENLLLSKTVTLLGEAGTLLEGNGDGNVVEVKSPGVVIKNFTIENSGRKDTEAGIYIESSNNLIDNNMIKNVHYGIYINNGEWNKLTNNQISSYPGHFSAQGNGIHLFETKNTEVSSNTIVDVQDGVYLDFAEETTLATNAVEQARYGYHVMYAKHGVLQGNRSTQNITGLMIMDAEDFTIERNEISKNIDYRGHGILIFDSDDIVIHRNQVTYNNTGLSLQDARDCIITDNTFAGNYIGLDLKNDNERNEMFNNNFISNIVQTKIFTKMEPMDAGDQGNYWDDYKGLDLDGDGIGEVPYSSGKWYDQLIEKNPSFQLFFESPSIKMWTAIESIFPAFSNDSDIDRYPLMDSVNLVEQEDGSSGSEPQLNWRAGLIGIVLISMSTFILGRGRL